MCYSGEMSAGFALIGAFMASYLRFKLGRPLRLCLPILYFGAMELLQTVQNWYIAEPEDDYAMCKNPVNRFLTFLGVVHIAFQPVFCNMIFTNNHRRHSIKLRIQGDLINKLCLLGAAAMAFKYYITWFEHPSQAPTPTKDCPNYEWLREGYDGSLNSGFVTPNLPGHSCTFRSATHSGHLAWAVPFYQSTYFVPGTFLHCFLMFAPVLAWAENFVEGSVAVLLFAGGPLLASYLTPSLNEQASIWCFLSMFQCAIAFVMSLFEPSSFPVQPKFSHEGTLGELPLEYAYVGSKTIIGEANGHNEVTEKQD